MMLPANYKYQTAFARKYYGQGKAEGRTEGRAEGRLETLQSMVTKLLRLRFGQLGKADLSRIASASSEELDLIAERVVSAASLADALGAPGKRAREKKRS